MPPKISVCRRVLFVTACLSGVLALGACSYTEGVVTSITGEDTDSLLSSTFGSSGSGGASAQSAPAAASTVPSMASTKIAAPVPSGADTGTPVGQKVRSVRGDLRRLSDNIDQHNADLQRVRATLSGDITSYSRLVGGINTRLQSGTTPDSPELVAQSGQARKLLDGMNGSTAELNALSSQVASDAAFANYVIQEIKAALVMPGAAEDDRSQLAALRSSVDRDVEVIHQLSRAVADDITRQNNYVANERRNLANLNAAIRNGEPSGRSVAATPPAASDTMPATAAPAAAPASVAQRRPLVTIRFDRPNVPYEQALFTAVNLAVERRPNAMFDLVAVSPSSGNAAQVSVHADQAKRNAENVMRALSRMGLPAERIAISAMTSSAVHDSEVRIFVR